MLGLACSGTWALNSGPCQAREKSNYGGPKRQSEGLCLRLGDELLSQRLFCLELTLYEGSQM